MTKSISLRNDNFQWEEYKYSNPYELWALLVARKITIGDGSKIGDWSTIGDRSKIGDWSTIGYNTAMFSSCLYKYAVSAYRNNKGEDIIQLGCHLRTRKDWDNDFWNNPSEFPNDDSENSQARLRAYKTACFFLDNLPKATK